MKKKVYTLLPRFSYAYALSVTTVMLVIMISCSSTSSVREIKETRKEEYGYGPGGVRVQVPKSQTGDALTKNLFQQYKRPNIELPYVEGSEEGGVRVLSEEVTFNHAETIEGRNNPNKPTSLNDVQHLNEVTITAKSRFTPEQDGKVNVDFIVKVPKEVLSDNYRITLSPTLLHNDSIVDLKDVIIKGENFADNQKQAYIDYESYLASIIDEADYDSVFVDYAGVRQDIKYYQDFLYKEYYKEWGLQTDYEKWKVSRDYAVAESEAKKTGYDKKNYHENARRAKQKAMKEFAKGKDTTGYFAKYMKYVGSPLDLEKGKQVVEQRDDYRIDFYKEYELKAQEQVMRDWAAGKDTVGAYARYMKAFDANMSTLVLEGDEIKQVPKKFRHLFRTGRTIEQIGNQPFTAQDSIEIAQHRYKFEEIEVNEMKKQIRDEKMKEMIIFPNEINAYLDSVVDVEDDFTFYYKQSYPVSTGLKKLRLVMNSVVDATDRSRFVHTPSDTLSYFISSLSQLVDTSMVVKKTTLYRDVFNSMVMYPQFPAGKSTFSASLGNNRAEVDKVIDTYRTFTIQGNLVMDSVELKVTTSLDGSYDKNSELAMKRGEALSEYFSDILGVADVFKVRYSTGEDWNTLAKLIMQRDDLANKEEVLEILTTAVYPDQTEADIKKQYPADFKIIRDQVYPKLNKAEMTFNMTRPGMTEEVSVKTEERSDYAEGLRLLQDREYWKALDILSNYPDYNAALCLVCMGYNAKALDLLETLSQTGNTEYLLAILSIRAKNDQGAIAHLMKACELDPTKAYRSRLDPEVAALVNQYGIYDQLVSISESTATYIDGSTGTTSREEGISSFGDIEDSNGDDVQSIGDIPTENTNTTNTTNDDDDIQSIGDVSE